MLGRKTKIAAALAAVAALVLPMSAASAAEQELEFTNDGPVDFVIGETTLTLPDETAGVSGTWDDESGDFVGGTAFNPISLSVTDPVALTIQVQIGAGSNNNVTGTIDPETGAADLEAVMQLRLEIPRTDIGGGVFIGPYSCAGPTFVVAFVAEGDDGLAPLPFEADSEYTMTLGGTFELPPFADSGCGAGNEAIAEAINDQLGLGDGPVAGTAELPLVRGTPVPSTTAAPPTTSAPTTTAAPIATSQPTFTG
jgi:hypothetical protein